MSTEELDDLHQHMVKTQVEGLEFYIKKYQKLADLTRAMKHPHLADILDTVCRQAEEALQQTKALQTSGVN